MHLSSQSLRVRRLGAAELGGPQSVTHEVAVKRLAGTVVIGGVIWASRSTSKAILSRDYWWEASVPGVVGRKTHCLTT